MTEAWMKRGLERQNLLDDIKRQIMDEEEESHNRITVQVPTIVGLLCHLANTDGVGFEELHDAQDSPAWGWFCETILPQVVNFARSKQEELALLAEILMWETTSVVNRYRQELNSQEIHEPDKVFGTSSAMDVVGVDT